MKHDLANENEQFSPADSTGNRGTFHAWKSEIAKRHRFPDLNYGEDWPWCEAMLKEVRTQARAGDAPLYVYNHNPETSEAR